MKRLATHIGILVVGIAIGIYGAYLASRYAFCIQPNVVYFRHDGPPMPQHFPNAHYVAGVEVTNGGFTVLIKQAPNLLDGFDKQVISVDTQRNSGSLTTYVSWPSPVTNTLDLLVQLSEMRSNRISFFCEGVWRDKQGFTNSLDVYGIVPLPFRPIAKWKQHLHSQTRGIYRRTRIDE